MTTLPTLSIYGKIRLRIQKYNYGDSIMNFRILFCVCILPEYFYMAVNYLNTIKSACGNQVLVSTKPVQGQCNLHNTTLIHTYNQLVYNKHLAIASRFICIKLIDCSVKKFSCSQHPLTMSHLFCILFTHCKRDPVNIDLKYLNASLFSLHLVNQVFYN